MGGGKLVAIFTVLCFVFSWLFNTIYSQPKKAIESDSCSSTWHIRKYTYKVMMRRHNVNLSLFIPSAFWGMANMPAVYSFMQLAFRCSEFYHSIHHHLPFAKELPLTSLGGPDCRRRDLPVCVSLKKTPRVSFSLQTHFFWAEKFSSTGMFLTVHPRASSSVLSLAWFSMWGQLSPILSSVCPGALWVMFSAISSHWF